MRLLTICTVLLLGAVTVAEAWQLIAFENGYSCDNNGRKRILRGGGPQCYTFGRDMPGTSCGQENFPNGGACSGAFTPRSIGLGSNDDCIIYNGNDCSGANKRFNARGHTPGCSSVGDVTRSFKCSILAVVDGATRGVRSENTKIWRNCWIAKERIWKRTVKERGNQYSIQHTGNLILFYLQLLACFLESYTSAQEFGNLRETHYTSGNNKYAANRVPVVKDEGESVTYSIKIALPEND
ncbi:hypothetical protein VTL71DRAFT_2855 [Oculimacula yallundae]|uniref:Uncharacterized protein n=1 Tax=Oculimacula yallundae TaxID=86028 RepID=A0ABR4CA15_9HELO